MTAGPLDEAVRTIRARTALEPRIGLILGSGLGGLADQIEDRVEIPYADIPGWPVATAVGHAGVLVLGTVDIPARSPPIARMKRISAGVSNCGPSHAA